MSTLAKKQSFSTLADLIKNRAMEDAGGYITQEFQDYGYRLATELDDMSHKSLYIKMAKTIDRKILESARTFVLDANANSKGRLFMWKVKELKKMLKEKEKKRAI
jgi:hypothetical protein